MYRSDVGAVGLSKNSKRKRKDPKFVDSWLEVKESRGWLAKRRGTDRKVKPYCKICLVEIYSTAHGLCKALKQSTVSKRQPQYFHFDQT